MKKVYYEDLEEGSVHWGGECIVDKDEMLEYNRKKSPTKLDFERPLKSCDIISSIEVLTYFSILSTQV
jgi:hypothetical protein